MTTFKRFSVSLFVLASLVGAAAVNAAGVDVNLGASVTGAPVTVTASSSGKATGSVNSSNSLNASVNANVPVNVQAGQPGKAGQNGASSSSASSSARGEAVLTIGRGDVSDSDSAAVSASSVSTSANLGAYARAVIKSDENVSKVEAKDGEVSVWYKEPAKLFGFIPARVSARATVKADGSVDVAYPWYSFLTAYSDDGLKADIDSSAGAIARAEASASFSASAKARLIQAIKSTMQAHATAQASASAEAQANQ